MSENVSNSYPMKISLPILFCILFFACKKDDHPVTPFRLKGMHTEGYNETYKTNLEYDGNGRITRITSQYNNETIYTAVNVTYNANEIVLTRPVVDNADQYYTDTIHFFMNGDMILKRIESRCQGERSGK